MDLWDARQARDAGMGMALDHAAALAPDWPSLAYDFLLDYARHHDTFVSEDVSDASRVAGMPQPPTDRAWGWLYRRAARAGVIRQDGCGRSRRRHASICPRWRSLVFSPSPLEAR